MYFFKQKTAYEMRISDWSSDVCSSDLLTRDTLLLRTSKAGAGRTPESPICDAVPAYLDALAEMAEWKDARRVELLHRLRDDARLRVARAKQQQRVQTYDDLIDRVARSEEHTSELQSLMRNSYAVF